MLHIGIVACSAEGAALCYRTICTEAPAQLGPHAHPEITMHTHSLADYVDRLDRGDMAAVGELMLSSAEKLARAGADFVICPDNTIHRALPYVEARSPLPWLHIAQAVADEAQRTGFMRLGLLGTRYLVQSNVYPQALSAYGLQCVLPGADERDEIHRIIMDELVYGSFIPSSVSYVQRVIEGMGQDGCDAVILGCTEIPLIIGEHDSPIPVLDSTRILAHTALRRAVKCPDSVASKS